MPATRPRPTRHTDKQLATWRARAERSFAKTEHSATRLRAWVEGAPKIIANMHRAWHDPTNTDWRWAKGQHLVMTTYMEVATRRLAELEGR